METLVKDTLALLKSKNSTYAFSSEQLSISGTKAIKVDVDVEKGGIPVKGIFIFTKTGNNTFEFMMTCPASVFSQESADFEEVIQSIRLR